jgi:hypothetical protein
VPVLPPSAEARVVFVQGYFRNPGSGESVVGSPSVVILLDAGF